MDLIKERKWKKSNLNQVVKLSEGDFNRERKCVRDYNKIYIFQMTGAIFLK